MRTLLGTVLLGFGMTTGTAQDCTMDQYAELTADSLRDPVMRSEVLALYPVGLLEDTSSAELIVVPGRTNCLDRAEFKGNGITVVIEGAPFDTTKHTFGYDRGQKVPFLCNIDGHGFWGTDGSMPLREIRSLNVSIQGRAVSVPLSALTNLFEPNFCDNYPRSADQPIFVHARCMLSNDLKRQYVHMMNSDGAGGYLVTWILLQGRYWGRVVEHGF